MDIRVIQVLIFGILSSCLAIDCPHCVELDYSMTNLTEAQKSALPDTVYGYGKQN